MTRNTRNTPIVFVLVGALALLTFCISRLPVAAAELQRFVDFDGDGFDDNAPDSDIDGIPDEIEFHGFMSARNSVDLSVSPMFSGSAPPPPIRPCASERFGSREFSTRGVSLTRSDFDTGFGSGLGLGSGLGGGGACAGGICF